jgi:uncharacterized membrane protein YfcA
MLELAAANLIVAVAALLQACTGFGFSVLATPFLLLVFPAPEAIQINIILSILISVVMLPKIRGAVDGALMRRLVLGSILGAPAGILIYLYADPDWLRMVIGVTVLAFTVLILRRVRLARSPHRDTVTGGLSGALTSGLGMPGPPLLVYFAGSGIAPAVLRGTTLAYFLFIYSASLALQMGAGSASLGTVITALGLTPATAVGVAAGQVLFSRISHDLFMGIAYGLLLLTGTYLVAATLLGL